MQFAVLRAVIVVSCLLAVVQAPHLYGDEQLRQCTNEDCRKYALSETWLFCPYCGTKLPAVVASSRNKNGGETVIGQIYKNHDAGFQIEVPDRKWRFLTKGNGLEDFHGDATVGLQSQDQVYGIVIVEKFPGVALADYAKLVAPKLQEPTKLFEKSGKLNGHETLKQKWSGTLDNVPFHFYMTLVAAGDIKYQVVNWCVASNDSKQTQAQVEAVEDSFKLLEPQDASEREAE